MRAGKKEDRLMSETQEGYNFLKLMKESFNPEEAEGLDVKIEIEFTDLEETHHFVIKDQKWASSQKKC